MKLAISSYPELSFFALEPIHLELRYIDVFSEALLGKTSLFDFTKKATSLQFGLPSMLTDKTRFAGEPKGRFQFQRPLKARKGSIFFLDIHSAQNNATSEDVVRMETKVVTTGAGVPALKSSTAKFLAQVDEWIEEAHDFCSPFFKQFIVDDIRKKFETTAP